ncbi:Hypothetical predicted protein [Olea europaea subsp. europaea]|uniref:Uncharacterized protein n=1 Tax=Olea europaea subsp. europaea TaxID=158383 RepID=A0A8S0PS48_OLEEU|nr:Hypothetical predicted protein [Olea europaea subsp. europaea]
MAMGARLFPSDMAIGVALAHVHRTVIAPHIVDSNRGRRACTLTVAFGVGAISLSLFSSLFCIYIIGWRDLFSLHLLGVVMMVEWRLGGYFCGDVGGVVEMVVMLTTILILDLVLGCGLGYGSSGEKERQEAKMIVALGPIVVLVMTVTVALDR